MSLVDANILLYAVDESSPDHEAANRWLSDQLNGHRRVGLPWLSLQAFIRIATHPHASARPMAAVDAWAIVRSWLACDVAWTPGPTDRHAAVFGELLERHAIAGNLVTDAALVALAIEHGLSIASADGDFARFDEIRWINPLH